MSPSPYSIGQLGDRKEATLRGRPNRLNRSRMSPTVWESSNRSPVNSAAEPQKVVGGAVEVTKGSHGQGPVIQRAAAHEQGCRLDDRLGGIVARQPGLIERERVEQQLPVQLLPRLSGDVAGGDDQ